MTKAHTVIVRQPRGGAVLEWRPSSERARLRELVQMLEDDPVSAEVAPIDLVEQSTARLLDPDSEVGELGERVLVARGRFLSYALDQLEALKGQSPSLISFKPVEGSPVIGIELRCPALQETGGKAGVRIRGRHQLLVVLPSRFPEAPPRVVWLTPILHPNVAMDRDVWPPGFDWGQESGLLPLLSALIETVAGLNVFVRGRMSLSRRKPLNDRASSWFRRHRREIAAYGRRALYSNVWRPAQLPLTSSRKSWVQEGDLHGGGPLVLLSGRFHRGLERFAQYAAGWLLGARGMQGEYPWYYVERAVPYHLASSPPASAVGFLKGTNASPEPVWSGPEDPIVAGYDHGGISLRAGSERAELAGYFVEDDGPPPGVGAPHIRVGPTTETVPAEIPGMVTDSEASLTPVSLAAAVCAYCGATCGPDRAWGACSECATDTHADCYDQIGGCPDTSCSLSPLYLGG